MRDMVKKRANDRKRYHERIDERRAYQREYYAANRERILHRRRERGLMKVVIRD